MSYTIESPFQYFPDPTKFGTLGLGSLYVGIVNGSPYLTPAQRQQIYVAVQGGPDLPISQPVPLGAGGVPLYNGSPCTLKILDAYSIAVVDYLGAQVYYSPRNGDEINEFDNLQTQIDALEANEQTIIESWSAISSTPVSVAGKLFTLKQHTSGGLGGGPLISFAGSVTDDNVSQKNSATPGYYLKRLTAPEDVTPEMAGALGFPTDDKVALQKYLDYCLLTNNRTNFGAKNYYTSGTLNITGTFRTFSLNGAGTGTAQTASTGGSCIVTNGTYAAIRAEFNTFANENISVKGLGFYNQAQDTLSGGSAIQIVRGASNGRYISGFKFIDTYANGYAAMFEFQGMNTSDANLNFFGNIRMEGANAQNCGIGLLLNNCTLNLLTMIDVLFFQCPYGGIKLERDGAVGVGNGKGSAIVASLFKCHMEAVGGMFRTQTSSTIDAGANVIRSAISLYDFTHESSGATIGPVTGDPFVLGTDTDVFVYGAAVRTLSFGENAFPVIKNGCTITSGTPIVCTVNAGGKILTPATVNAPKISQLIANGGNFTFTVTHTDALGYAILSRLLFAGGQAGVLEVFHTGIDTGTRVNTVRTTAIGAGITVTYPAGAGTSVANINVANATGFGLQVDYFCENYSNSTITQ